MTTYFETVFFSSKCVVWHVLLLAIGNISVVYCNGVGVNSAL